MPQVLTHAATEQFAMQQLSRYEAAAAEAMRLRAQRQRAAGRDARQQGGGGAGSSSTGSALQHEAWASPGLMLLVSEETVDETGFVSIVRSFYSDSPERLAGLQQWRSWAQQGALGAAGAHGPGS